jgi:hypothetical protein
MRKYPSRKKAEVKELGINVKKIQVENEPDGKRSR